MRLQPDYDPNYCPHCGERLAMAYVAIKEDSDGVDWWGNVLQTHGEKRIDQHLRLRGSDTRKRIDTGTVPITGVAVFVHAPADPEAVMEIADTVGYADPDLPDRSPTQA